ncbi:hypothetical protein AAFF_G00203050 [Aldrovandia affinis]|uniref:Uncharacterized protein n=1 Tax=Aldrovandia affinis TaxID=143900 RepID=A0AAD7WW07_9TELE|nr:hypothetical protein AAFF_G00203050 [Aldrovandia affinis]
MWLTHLRRRISDSEWPSTPGPRPPTPAPASVLSLSLSSSAGSPAVLADRCSKQGSLHPSDDPVFLPNKLSSSHAALGAKLVQAHLDSHVEDGERRE